MFCHSKPNACVTDSWTLGQMRFAIIIFATLCSTLVTRSVVAQVPPPLPLPGGVEPDNPLFNFNRVTGEPMPPINFGPDGRPLLPAPLPPGYTENVPDLAPLQVPEPEMTPAERKLLELAIKVAPSVVAIRVWDEYGDILSSGVGCFVHESGLLLTDAGLLHPEIASRIDYITTTAADGRNHRVTGWYAADLVSGVALLHSEDAGVEPLKIKTGTDFSRPTPCHLFAVSEKRGLVLADARLQQDQSLAGQGWLNVRGDESPGAPGSPVLDGEGNVIAIVGMKVPLKTWMNFALPAEMAAYESQRRLGEAKPLSTLPTEPRLKNVTEDKSFLAAYQALTENKVMTATRRLLALTRKYPRSAECWALLGLSASRLGAATEAVNCQRKAVALDPRTGLYWHQLATAQLRQHEGKPVSDEDKDALQQAAALRPADPLTWFLLATRQLQNKAYNDADDALRQVIKLEPDYAPAYYLLAFTRSRLRDYTGALTAAERSLELDSRSADTWFLKALLLDKQGKVQKAIEAYTEVTRLNPRHPHAWQHLAQAHQRSGNTTAARVAIRQRQAIADEGKSSSADVTAMPR